MLVVEQTLCAEFTRLVASDRHSQCLGDILLVAQYRQHMLLAVTELAAISYHTNTQQTIFFGHVKTKRHSSIALTIYLEGLCLRSNYLIIYRIKQSKYHIPIHGFFSKVGYHGSDIHLVAHSYKTWHIRLQHEIFLRHNFRPEVAHHHILGVRDASEVPTCKTLRHRERNHHLALLISTHLRIEESCLGKVGTQRLSILFDCSTINIRFCLRCFLNFYHFAHTIGCSLRHLRSHSHFFLSQSIFFHHCHIHGSHHASSP